MPFIRRYDEPRDVDDYGSPVASNIPLLAPISAARCARVSYLSFETGRPSTIEEDLRLYDRFAAAQPMHLSPLEHQATPDTGVYDTSIDFEGTLVGDNMREWGNFIGWRQFRKMILGEAVAALPEEYTR
jgi:hypothetical protein